MKGYRFFSNPNHSVTDGETGRFLFKFDYKGEYVTLDPILANRMIAHFRHEEIELVEVKEQATEKVTEKVNVAGDDAQVPCFDCPTCGFKAVNKSGLVNHIRAKHKEG
jgi:hypothetical protein